MKMVIISLGLYHWSLLFSCKSPVTLIKQIFKLTCKGNHNQFQREGSRKGIRMWSCPGAGCLTPWVVSQHPSVANACVRSEEEKEVRNLWEVRVVGVKRAVFPACSHSRDWVCDRLATVVQDPHVLVDVSPNGWLLRRTSSLFSNFFSHYFLPTNMHSTPDSLSIHTLSHVCAHSLTHTLTHNFHSGCGPSIFSKWVLSLCDILCANYYFVKKKKLN